MDYTNEIDQRDWPLLLLLSILWGSTFFFVGIAVTELSPPVIVLARVALASVCLVPIMLLRRGGFPSRVAGWMPFVIMGLLNNVIPFYLIASAQTKISSGLASVLNGTTPLFTVVIAWSFGDEKFSATRFAGLVLGFLGVVVLHGSAPALAEGQTLGTVYCLGAAASYGFAGLWGRRQLSRVPPLTSATCQLVSASIVMLMLALCFQVPIERGSPSVASLLSLLGLSTLSTALAYILFFKILIRSGATNVMLVTLLIPVTSILLGHFFLGETITKQELFGALIIGSALLLIDGRILRLLNLPG